MTIDKSNIRSSMLKHCSALAQGERNEAAIAITQSFLKHIPHKQYENVAGYYPIRHECDPMVLMRSLSDRGKNLLLPSIKEKRAPLVFKKWSYGKPLVKGIVYDIPEPEYGVGEAEPDIVLVPMVAFDRQGYRLGYGGGFYDRTLERLRARKKIICVGIAYSIQEVNSLPKERHDERLDYIVTEKEILAF